MDEKCIFMVGPMIHKFVSREMNAHERHICKSYNFSDITTTYGPWGVKEVSSR